MMGPSSMMGSSMMGSSMMHGPAAAAAAAHAATPATQFQHPPRESNTQLICPPASYDGRVRILMAPCCQQLACCDEVHEGTGDGCGVAVAGLAKMANEGKAVVGGFCVEKCYWGIHVFGENC